MDYLGDFPEDSTVNIYFTTSDGSGGAVAPSSAFEAADIAIYKDNSAVQKITTNGLTMTSPFDAVTGLHLISIDTSNDTGDVGFWVTGSDFTVVLNPDETVDGQTVVKVLAQFSIENRTTFPKADYPTNFAVLGIEADGDLTQVDSLTGHTPQTGDNYVRLGAPVGADISTDIAGVQSDTDNIQTRLPAALVGARMDSSVGAMAADVITAAAIAANAIGASELATDGVQEIADTILQRDMDQVEVGAPVHSLVTAILKAVARAEDDGAGNLDIYRTDGVTLYATQTISTDPTADPIDGLGGAT
jgi:hypothetical protein